MFLVALLVGLSFPVVAYDDTKTFKGEETSNNIAGKSYAFPNGVISLVANNNPGASTPRIQDSNSVRCLRLRSNNMLTISSTEQYVITKIEMTFHSNNGGDKTVNAYDAAGKSVTLDKTPTLNNNVYTIEISRGASRVTMTNSSGVYISQIKVFYADKQPTGPINPTLKVSGPNNVTVGETVTLTVDTDSDGAIECAGNNYVETTVQGKQIIVKGLKYWSGSTLTISTKQTDKYIAKTTTHSFSVSRKNATPTLTATSTSLAVGGSTQLTVSGSDGRVTYKSDNENVAVVDQNGKVTAKGDGVATITATIAASDTYNATTVTIKITVAAPSTPDTEEPEELDGNGATVYYIRNVSTGLYIKYGGSYGMDAIEGRAAHPFKLYSKGNNVYALASIHGYFNSMYSNASLFMDRPESESNWTFQRVENTSDVYYLRGENSKALASVGNQYGILEFRTHDTKDIYQKWQLITEDKLREEMAGATVAAPVDITPFIKGAAFDYADHKQPGNQFFTAEETPFYGEITEEAGSLPWNNTPVAERIVGDGIFNWEDAEHSEWQLTHSYVNYWDGFKRMEHYGARWSDDPSVGSNTNLNGIGLSRNNIHNEYMVEQYIGELPAGTYVLSYQGFYATTYSGEVPTVSVATATGDADLADEFSEKLDNYTNSSISSLLSSSADNRGLYVATMFRDNRENDSYRGSIQFKLTEPKHVGIRIHKNSTNPETGGDYGSRYQWMIAFDDFTLIYQGNENTVVDQSILYYDRVKEAYLYYSKKVSELGVPASYPDPDKDSECNLDGCVHWTAWKNAIDGVVSVNGVDVYGDPDKVTIPAENNKIAYLNGTAASNKIDTEKEFLEALSKIEAAYQAALKEHNSHLTNFTGLIENPCFEEGFTKNYQDGIERAVSVDVKGWNRVFVYGWHNNVWYDQDENVIMSTGTTTAHDDYYFNSWRGVHGKEAEAIQQDITISEKGLYELSALVSTYAKGDDAWDNGGAITDYTVFLTAGTYHSGVVPHSKDNFVEHKLLFLVEQENTNIVIGAVGGDGAGFNLYDPRGGGFFRADCFKLTKVSDLPNGRVRLALDEVKKITLDKYGQEVINFSDYENMVNNSLVTGDGTAVVNQLYAEMKKASLAQKTRNADMTWAIENANFELGETGWNFTETPENWETGVFPHDKAKASIGADGGYLFNTWSADGANCKEITQTISGLRNGTYRLSAMVASTNGNKMTIKAGTASGEVTCIGDNDMVEVSCEFTVTGGPEQTITIGVYNNSTWYKADNFRLTFLHNKLELDHTKDETATVKADWYTDVDLLRPVATGKWHSFVVPYSMPVPKNWDVRELTNGTIDETGTHLYMVFNRVTEMVGGTPYMVRYYPQGVPADVDLDVNTDSDTSNDDDLTKQQTNIITEYVDVNLSTPATSGEKTVTGNPAETSTLEFVGSYVPTTIPEGAIFISNNKFYVSKGTSTIKGYRGYIVPKGAAANVRSFGMHTRGGQSTSIESANKEEATVVGIYDINGIKMNEMQDGLNIIRMSDGTTIKILMK